MDTLTNITLLNNNNNNTEMPVSSSIVIQKKKRGNIANLKMFPKGVSGNPKGKPKGTVQIKDRIRKKLTIERADNIAESIIIGSESGDDKKRADLLKLTGDFNDAPQVMVNNNTLTLPASIIEELRAVKIKELEEET